MRTLRRPRASNFLDTLEGGGGGADGSNGGTGITIHMEPTYLLKTDLER